MLKTHISVDITEELSPNMRMIPNLFIDTIMTGYLLVKLARPSCNLPDDIKAWFESFKEEEEDRAMYEAYRYLFGNARQGDL